MPTPRRGWTIAYFAAWVVALAPVGALAGQILLKFRDQQDGTDAWWVLGGLAGAAMGLVLARATRGATTLHRVFGALGPFVVVAGVALAVWKFVAASRVRGQGMFAGFGEFVLGLLGCFVVLFGAAMWSAGKCGPRAPRP